MVAEGVEEEAARDALREMDCDEAQGFLVSRPMPLDRFEAWLQSRTVSITARRDHPGVADDELSCPSAPADAAAPVELSGCTAGRSATLICSIAPLAQSAERLHGKEKVYGSIP